MRNEIKAIIGILGTVKLVVLISGCTSSDNSTSTAPTSQPPTQTTIAGLYNNEVTTGTTVQVTGTVLQSDGQRLRISDANGKDIMVEGSSLNGYENQKVTVKGTFTGPNSYDTAMGSSRTVPFIEDATIV